MEKILSGMRGWNLDHKQEDIRGWPLRDAAGRPLGTVSELAIDTDTRRLSHIILADGRRYAAHDVILGDRYLTLDRRSTEPAPKSEPRPAAPSATTAPARAAGAPEEASSDRELVVPLIDEELEVSKRRVDAGGVQVQTHVVEEPIAREVRLREDHVTVERRPVDRPLDSSQADSELEDKTIEVTGISEQPLVLKRAHVVEEVVLKKEAVQRVEHVREAVRHTEVEISELAGANHRQGARP